jgi:hypothetical protein
LSTRARVLFESGRPEQAARTVDELLTDLPQAVGRSLNVEIAWLVAALGRLDVFLALLERAGRRTLWLEAARAIVAGRFADAAELFAQIGSAPNAAFAQRRAAEALVGEGRRGGCWRPRPDGALGAEDG